VVSLTPEVARHPRLVGEAIASVQRNVKAVYAKIATRGEYRVQRLIHLYGEKRTHTIYRENGLRFWVDLASMYVNPSLATEHLRIARLASDGERMLDMFTGFGGFPINAAALRRIEAVAVDLNPAALQALRRSLGLNRLRGLVHPVHTDSARLDRVLKGSFHRIIMNLPHRATEYLPVACRLAGGGAWIHVYVVAGSCGEAARRVLGAAVEAGCIDPRIDEARRVVDYAPRTYIYVVDMQVGSRAMRTS
jgi:tRNA (guanine37-N1)-methyltransferase